MATRYNIRGSIRRARAEGLRELLARRKVAPYWFLLPYFFFFFLFYGWPMVWAPLMSLQEFTLRGTTWVGLANYENIFTTSRVWESFFNTIVIALIKMPVTIGGGLLLAVVVNSKFIRHKRTWRTVFLSPLTVSGVVMTMLFLMLLEPSGIINWILESTLGFKLFWIEGGPWIAKVSVAFVGMLGGISTNFIFFLAGLAGIPEHLYDAAKIDGADWWQQFRHVTLPQLRPMLLLVIILETNRGIKLFAPAQLLTQGGPQGATETVVLRLYREAFTNLNLGYAAAIGVIVTAFLSILMIIEYVIGDEDVR